ncbi:unnamed protein product, partial [marine sediment metagenome]
CPKYCILHMAGSGNWQKFFPGEAFYTLYEKNLS